MDYGYRVGNIIPGLESEMLGMKIGDSKRVVVAAADGYGKENEKGFMVIPHDQIPKEVSLKVGTEMQIEDQSGQPMYARIEKVGDKIVHLDLNHPLVGKELQFSVKVVSLRKATSEEKEHGHVHGASHHQ